MKTTKQEKKDFYKAAKRDMSAAKALDWLIHTYQGNLTIEALREFQQISREEIFRSCQRECDLVAATFIAAAS